jgi:glycosyltransferase involved in cell wall biosynthesis
VAIDGVRMIRIPDFRWLGPVRVGPSVLKLFLDVFLAIWIIGLVVRHRYDFVHAHEEAGFICSVLKPIFGFRLIYDMHSSLPQQLENFSFTKSRLLINVFNRLERRCLRSADAVITICPDLARRALAQREDPTTHFLIENSLFEDVKLAPSDVAEADSERAAGDALLALSDNRRLVVYAGSLEPYQGIDLLLRSIEIVHRQCPDVVLLVVGGAPSQVRAYAAQAKEMGLAACCRFIGMVAQGQARRLTAAASVQVSPRTRGTNTPLKVYEQLANSIPLVATDIDSHRQVLDESVAFLAAPEPEQFAAAIIAALTDDTERLRRVAAAKRLYAENYSRSAYVAKMRQLLERIR